jgi:hypothetical protein
MKEMVQTFFSSVLYYSVSVAITRYLHLGIQRKEIYLVQTFGDSRALCQYLLGSGECPFPASHAG